jgi:alkylation response protein AidB-like acyl-CoA dehydrogenase
MNFEFSDEQSQLKDSVDRYLSEQYAFEKFRAVNASAAGWDRATWQGLAELGVLGINVPAAEGGLGFGPLETLAMMGLCGRNLLLEPVLSSAVIATALLAPRSDDAAVAQLLGQMAGGEQIAVLAHFEPDSRFETQWTTTRARRSGAGYVLDGHKAVVMHAPAADVLLVSARTAGEAQDAAGISLFRVPRSAAGLTLDVYPTLDGQRAADVYLKGVQIPESGRVGAEGGALAGIEAAIDMGLSALCAESVGIMQALVEATVQYVQSRQQFGQPIGKFQALQHRIADMFIMAVQARSMSLLATGRCDSADPARRRHDVAAAKAFVGKAARFVGQQAVQLHGGMGLSAELLVSHYFKRLTLINATFGDTEHQLTVIAGSMHGQD